MVKQHFIHIDYQHSSKRKYCLKKRKEKKLTNARSKLHINEYYTVLFFFRRKVYCPLMYMAQLFTVNPLSAFPM